MLPIIGPKDAPGVWLDGDIEDMAVADTLRAMKMADAACWYCMLKRNTCNDKNMLLRVRSLRLEPCLNRWLHLTKS